MLSRLKSGAVFSYEILRTAARQYGEDRAARMAAAVSYRAIFAVAPLLLVAVFVFGRILGGSGTAESEILSAVERFAGQEVEDAVRTILRPVQESGSAAGVAGFVLLLWTASSLFMEVQNDLNDIFGVPYEHTTGVVAFIRKRGLGFLAALGLGIVLIAVWMINSVWQFLGGVFPESFEPVHRLIGLLAPLVSVVVLPFVLGLTFQVLCRAKVRWRAIWWGAFWTSIAFLAAAYGISLYFDLSQTNAATLVGSAFVILLLAFVLSSVYLFGAEVTKVFHIYLETGEFDETDTALSPQVTQSQ
ncbi:MAG TPA: YihY/virulence factor BrkB family protein [Acidimicrobiia bacterium]|nr:YihY/virulence factor BrkB family protein [Acidimicrobiia bacterium]